MNNIRLAQPLLIRFARLEDAHALHTSCFPEEGYDSVEDYLRWCLDSPERPARLIAVLDGYLVAHVELTSRQNGTWAEISHLVVSEPFRQQNLAPRVIGAAVRLARRWGCSEIRLQVPVEDQERMNNYQRWGFYVRGFPLAGYCWLALPVSFYPIPPTPRRSMIAYSAPKRVQVGADL